MVEDIDIQMAIHFLCSSLEKDKKMIDKISSTVSKKEPDEIYMFLMALGSGILGVSDGLSKLDKNFVSFTKRLCKNLNTDDSLAV